MTSMKIMQFGLLGMFEMCRFLAYIGKKTIKLSELLEKPKNSLINQSFNGQLGTIRVHADGCGFGWYDQHKKITPSIFKSLQPAWSDQHFKLLSTQISSNCFIGHIRAASVGAVSYVNAHPFAYDAFLFAHNGTIYDFPSIKQAITQEISESIFTRLQGQTDSEYFFALLMEYVQQDTSRSMIDTMIHAFNKSIKKIYAAKHAVGNTSLFKLNTVLTDGKTLIATRFISDLSQEPLSLFYASARPLICPECKKNEAEGYVISSEPLTEVTTEWREVPKNSMLIIQDNLQIRFLDIPMPQLCIFLIFFIKKIDI